MSRSGYITLIILLLVVTFAVIFYLNVLKQNDREALQESPAANSLKITGEGSYTDIYGNKVSLDQYVGKNLLALAWASWCPSCGQQLQLLARAAGNNQDIKVLAFNRAEPLSTAKSYLNFYGLNDTVELIMDPSDHFFNSVNGYAMPEVIIFNTKGEIVHHERGEISEGELNLLLRNLNISTSQN